MDITEAVAISYGMEKVDAPVRAGRPRAFDREVALRAALQLFWRHGYDGASLADLTDAMGIQRPSLYAAFGNKEALFREALELYGREQGSFFEAALAAHSALGVAELFLRGALAIQTSDSGPRGCFNVIHAVACGQDTEPVRAAVLSRFAELEGALRARFERASAEGDLPDGVAPADLARHLLVVSQGMAIQAGAGVSRAELEGVIAIALRLLRPRRGSSPS